MTQQLTAGHTVCPTLPSHTPHLAPPCTSAVNARGALTPLTISPKAFSQSSRMNTLVSPVLCSRIWTTPSRCGSSEPDTQTSRQSKQWLLETQQSGGSSPLLLLL